MGSDSVKLLKECNAGIKMGITSLDEVLEHVTDNKVKKILTKSKEKHVELGLKAKEELAHYGEEGKEPAAMAKMMSWIKTNVKLNNEDSDRVVADLITDGCNMGVKSLFRYLHQYKAADESAKALAEEVIKEEEQLANSLREFL